MKKKEIIDTVIGITFIVFAFASGYLVSYLYGRPEVNTYNEYKDYYEYNQDILTEDKFEDLVDELVDAFEDIDDSLNELENVEIIETQVVVDGKYTEEQVIDLLDDVIDALIYGCGGEYTCSYQNSVLLFTILDEEGNIVDWQSYTMEDLLELVD